MNNIDKLKNILNKDISDFILNDKKFLAKVVDIYSQSFVKLVILLDNIVLKFNCTLINLDSGSNYINELKNLSTDIAKDLDIQNLTKKQRIQLLDKNKKIILVHCHNFNKDGILQVSLYDNIPNSISYNNIILKKSNNSIVTEDKDLIFNMSPSN